MAGKYRGKVKFASENFGESELARRFGINRYPAVFVGDVLIAKPNDFGFFGAGEKAGRYAPFRDARNHKRFQDDLSRMIDLALKGKTGELAREAGPRTASEDLPSLPAFTAVDLDGNPLTPDQLAGRPVVVEFWATWCPPCRETLSWLGGLKARYGGRIAVVAFAVESPEDGVRRMTDSLSRGLRWAMATPETASAFGDIVAVPTMYVFAPDGKTAGTWYGAPPERHSEAEKLLDRLLAK